MALLRAGCAAAILVVAPLAAQNQTTFGQAYEEGLAAQKRGDHAIAVAALRRALELRPQSSARVLTYGNNFTSYYPQVYLAESLLALGKLDEAARALEASAKSKVEPSSLREKAELRLKELRAARKPEPVRKPEPATMPIQAPPATVLPAPQEPPKKAPEVAPKNTEHIPVEKTQQPSQQLTYQDREKQQVPATKPIIPAASSAAPLVSGSVPIRETASSSSPTPTSGQGPLAEVSRQPSYLTFTLALAAIVAALGGLGYWIFLGRQKRRPKRGQINQRTVAMSQPISAELMSRLQHLPTDLGLS